MSNHIHLASAGIKTFPVAELTPAQLKELGPLAHLIGTWENVAAPAGTASSGWNVIMVPAANNGFRLEVIPYTERLVFEPVLIAAANKGPFENPDKEEIQHIVGLMYVQKISSVCTTQCEDPELQAPNVIHMETGLFLNVQDYNTQAGTQNKNGLVLSFARLSTVPHGNSVLAVGQVNTMTNFTAKSIPDIDGHPTPINPYDHFGVGYTSGVGNNIFKEFNQMSPNSFLRTTIDGQKFKNVTRIEMDTDNASGGILNIPFLQNNVKASKMSASFWIEELENGAYQLQYSQLIDLIFPGVAAIDASVTFGGKIQPIQVRWPHTTINTMTKLSQ